MPQLSRILIVDDNELGREALGDCLALEGYELLYADNGVTALEMADAWLPDVILLDVMMPGMDGFEVCRRLRSHPVLADVPVLLVTALDDRRSKISGLDAGADDFITKPFDRLELRARIRTITRLNRYRKLRDEHARLETAYQRLLELNRSLERFVPRDFLRFLNKQSISEIQLGDQSLHELTILFSDIRSFTNLSEAMTPEQSFGFLNGVLRRVGPIIRENGGFVDKYIGDGMMALFQGPTLGAIHAAMDIQSRVRQYNIERVGWGLKPIRLGIGIHRGPAILGIIGEQERMESTAISDAVNLSSRIESLNKLFGTDVLLSLETLQSLDADVAVEVRRVGRVRVKGKSRTTEIYELLSALPEDECRQRVESRSEFETLVDLLASDSEREQCSQMLEVYCARYPDDVVARAYQRRCEKGQSCSEIDPFYD